MGLLSAAAKVARIANKIDVPDIPSVPTQSSVPKSKMNPLVKKRDLVDDTDTDFYSPVLSTIEQMTIGKKGSKGENISAFLQKRAPNVAKSELESFELDLDPQRLYTREELVELAKEKGSTKYLIEEVDSNKVDTFADDQRQFVQDEELDFVTLTLQGEKDYLRGEYDAHFGGTKNLGHTRSSIRRELPIEGKETNDNNKYLLIEEIQSDTAKKRSANNDEYLTRGVTDVDTEQDIDGYLFETFDDLDFEFQEDYDVDIPRDIVNTIKKFYKDMYTNPELTSLGDVSIQKKLLKNRNELKKILKDKHGINAEGLDTDKISHTAIRDNLSGNDIENPYLSEKIDDGINFLNSEIVDHFTEKFKVTDIKKSPILSRSDYLKKLILSNIVYAKKNNLNKIVIPNYKEIARQRTNTFDEVVPKDSPYYAKYEEAMKTGDHGKVAQEYFEGVFKKTYKDALDKVLNTLKKESNNTIKIKNRELRYGDLTQKNRYRTSNATEIDISKFEFDPTTEKLRFNKGGMPNKKIGTKTDKKTQAGRDVYKTPEGEMVSEKSTTFEYRGKWINVPTIHGGKQYSEDQLLDMLDKGLIKPTSTHTKLEEAIKAAQSRSDSLEFNKGGIPMQKQMELFEEGGLKDEGGMIDEESGNEVPVGGTRKGVRDDIPANVSEGEFIFPEDVTRYIGLDKLMQLRQEAKMGLKRMEAMGQMGNSDEATMEDDLPFGMADLIIVGGMPEGEEELDMAEGGLTTTSTGSRRTIAQPTVQEPTTPVTTQPTVTRRLTPEPIVPEAISIDFKNLMGEAAIEYKEYRNAAGESMMISFIGGEPVYPIPDGYTLYTGEGAVGSGTVGTTADSIAYATNTATAEYRQSGGDNDTPPPMPTAEAINWGSLTTKELIAESSKLTGMGATIAKGAMAFLGPFGAIGYAMMRHQDKKVAQEIADRIAKGGLTASQLATLKETQEKLTPKGFTLIGKVIETVGKALGFGEDEVETTKKSAGVSEGAANRAPDDATSTAEVAATITQEIVNANQAALEEAALSAVTMQQPTDPLEPFGSAGPDIPSMPIEDVIASEAVAPYDYTDPRNLGGAEGYGQTGIVPQQPVAAEPVTPDQIYSAKQALIQDAFQTNVANIRDPRKQGEATGYNRQIDPSAFYSQDIDMGAAGYGPQPVQQQTASAFGLPREDFSVSVPETKFTAPAAPAYKPLEDYQAPSQKNIFSEKDAGTFFSRAGTKAKSLLTGTPVSALQAENLGYSTEQPVRTSNIDVVPPSPVTNLDLRPTSVGTQTQQAFDFGKEDTAMSMPVQTTQQQAQQIAQQQAQAGPDVPGGVLPASVQQQTNQLFSGSTYDEVPTMAAKENYTSRLDTKGLTPTPTPTPTQPFNLGSAEGQLSTSPDLTNKRTFNEEFNLQRKAGAKEFSYDRDGDGKLERYTTQTAEEAAPAGTNTLVQNIKNLFTPFDDKEYVGGKLVSSKTKKPVSTTKKTTSSSGRTTAEIQADINKETKNGKVWTSRANALVKEREASKSKSSDKNIVTAPSGKKVTVQTKPSSNKTEGAVSAGGQYAGDGFEWKKADNGNYLTRTYTGVNKNATGSNDTSSASSSSSSKIVCTAMNTSYGFGSYRQAIWLSYSEKNLTKAHEVGYHTLFKPLVKLGYKKNNKIVRAILENIARNRTADLRAEMQGKKRNTLGRIYRAILEPTCYIVGKYKMFKDK